MHQFPFKYFNKNLNGRDFVVGDLHGMFSLFESQLESLDFDPKSDRVFSVGDLIDRGPESHRVLEFLDKPWFHSIKGNHEMMLIEARHRKTNYRSWVNKYGGGWWQDITPEMQQEIRERLKKLSVAFEITCDTGQIGIVHADVPANISWQKMVQQIHHDDETRDYLMWSRNRYKYIKSTGETDAIEGIDLVVMGHTPISQPMHIENIYYIDTGATYIEEEDLGRLTLLQIHPKIEVHQYPQPLT
ncbi:MAG: metallophosphoesterase [Cocleimonas sp.]